MAAGIGTDVVLNPAATGCVEELRWSCGQFSVSDGRRHAATIRAATTRFSAGPSRGCGGGGG